MSLEKFKEAKILIVDDEPTNLRVLYNLLKEYQFKLFTIQDSTTVIETLVQNIPDLILLDIMMPGINGFELCKQIKEKEELSNIPIIFISALNDTKNILKGFELGGNDYISKPFQSEEVLARIKNQLTIKYQAKFLEEKNKELTELNSMKNKFFSIIAHDVRNPFSAILGLSEILQDDFDNLEKEQMKSMVGHIHNSTNKCYKLLENLLQWANSQLNKVEVSPVNNNLLNHVNKVLEIFQMQAENKKITLSQNVPESIFYYADINLVDLIIRNLVNNAIKFTPENGSIQISAEKSSELIEISVKDSGMGIPPEILNNLFKIGSKVTRKGSNKEDGTGLGLILVHEFVKNSGGDIRIESEVDKGSNFIFTLPEGK